MAARQKQDVAHLDSITDVVLFQVLAGFSDVVPIIVQSSYASDCSPRT